MNSEKFNDLINNVRIQVNIPNFEIKISDGNDLKYHETETYNEYSEVVGYHIMPRGVIDDQNAERGKYIYELDKSSIEYFSENEMRAVIAGGMFAAKVYDSGYVDIIEKGILRSARKIPELQHYASNVLSELMDSSSNQMLIENGFEDELNSLMDKEIEAYRDFYGKCEWNYRKALGLEDTESRLHNEEQLMALMAQIKSAPYFAVGKTKKAVYLDEVSKETLKLFSVEDNFISEFDTIRKLLTIKNPPEIEKIEKNTLKILKICARLM